MNIYVIARFNRAIQVKPILRGVFVPHGSGSLPAYHCSGQAGCLGCTFGARSIMVRLRPSTCTRDDPERSRRVAHHPSNTFAYALVFVLSKAEGRTILSVVEGQQKKLILTVLSLAERVGNPQNDATPRRSRQKHLARGKEEIRGLRNAPL